MDDSDKKFPTRFEAIGPDAVQNMERDIMLITQANPSQSERLRIESLSMQCVHMCCAH